jgi:hypothetical protein
VWRKPLAVVVVASALGLVGLAAPCVAAAALRGNGLIAFQRGVGGKSQIFVMRADGGGVVRISDGTASDKQPVWSPDGTRIAFRSLRTGNGDIYIMNADGTGLTRVTTTPKKRESNPTWSPDGTKIAFSCEGDPCGIRIIGVDGIGVTEIAGRRNYLPAWSPLGGRIAFVRNVGICVTIRTMRPDGTGIKIVTPCVKQHYDNYPAWSPDARWITFSTYVCCRGLSILSLVHPDGSGRHSIGSGAVAAWAPDGDKLVVARREKRLSPIMSMNTHGADAIVIADPGTSPSWQSLACTVTGTSGDDALTGTAGDDVICAGAGDDVVDGMGGSDVISGGRGVDTISYASSGAAIMVRLPLHATGRGLELLSGFENAIGSPFADVITGSDSPNLLSGGAGDDHLRGVRGADTLRGGAGDDSERGGSGPDVLRGGAGPDRLDGRDGAPGDFLSGGVGNDTCFLDPGDIAILC